MNKLRFRTGHVQLHKLPVNEATVIDAGDLVYLDNGFALPAADFPFTTNADTTRGNFAAKFVGVAHQPSAQGESEPISVDVSPLSVYEFDVAADAFDFGAPLAPDIATDVVQSQRLKKVTNPQHAIARTVETRPAGSTTSRITFASAFHTASSNINASIG